MVNKQVCVFAIYAMLNMLNICAFSDMNEFIQVSICGQFPQVLLCWTVIENTSENWDSHDNSTLNLLLK